MSYEGIDKIDKCAYCNEKAEYILLKVGIFSITLLMLCNKHRLQFRRKLLRI